MITIPKIHVYRSSVVRFFLRKAHTVILPGENGASLYEVGYIFIKKLFDSRLAERAAAVTYNLIMALPPMFLFIFSLLPYLPFRHIEQTILYVIRLITPNDNIYGTVSSIAVNFINQQHHGALSFGLLLVLYFSSNGMVGLMKTFDYNESLYKKRTPLQRRFTAIKLTLMHIFITILAMAVLFIQTKNLNPLIVHVFHYVQIVKIISTVILIIVVFIGISVIYTYGPSLTEKFSFISIGSVFATCGSLFATSVFFFLVNHFLNYNKVYGPIGTLIGFLVLLWLNTIILLVGYEINVSLLKGRLSHETSDYE